MVYLDNAATTKIHPLALEAMIQCHKTSFANPGSIHAAGWEAKKKVELARSQVASVINANTNNVIFTSGGSESNSLALGGLVKYLLTQGKTHILASPIEHKSVIECMKNLDRFFIVEMLPVSPGGSVETSAVESRIRENTGLVSVMYINNETGVENDIDAIARLCHVNGALFHTDCVQAFGKRPIDVSQTPVDFLTASAHKLHGPKGVGLLYAKDPSILSPSILGGNQEFGLRAGTENVPGIVGFGVASQIAADAVKKRFSGTPAGGIRRIIDELTHKLDGICHINGKPRWFSEIVNLRFDGVSGEALVLMLSSLGIMVSAGSACTSTSNHPSHVLKAMGLTDEEARSSIRISLADDITPEEEQEAIDKIVYCVTTLRDASNENEVCFTKSL